MTDVILRISGMDCGACAVRIVRALRALPGLREVSVSDTAGSAHLIYDDTVTDLAQIARCVQRAGFAVPVETAELSCPGADAGAEARLRAVCGVRSVTRTGDSFTVTLWPVGVDAHVLVSALGSNAVLVAQHGGEEAQQGQARQRLLRRLGLGVLLTAPLLWRLPGYVQLVLATAVLFAAGAALWRGAWRALRGGGAAPETAGLLAAAVLYGDAVFAVFAGQPPQFAPPCGIVCTLLAGKYAAVSARGALQNPARRLRHLIPRTATVVRGGTQTQVDADALTPHDTVLLAPGERVPVDGVVCSGACTVDASALAGASRPAEKTVGDTLRQVLTDTGYPPSTHGMGGIVVDLICLVLVGVLYWGLPKLLMLVKVPALADNASLGLVFLVGLLTSTHCIGMCGGILLAQTTDARGVTGRSKRGLIASAAYNGGRVVSYTAVGAACGALGAVITYTPDIKSMVFTIAGALVLLIGLRMAGILPGLRGAETELPGACSLNARTRRRFAGRPLIIGLLTGIMPCGALSAMWLYAMSSDSALRGALVMLVFSLGTVPLLFAFGALQSFLPRGWMKYIVKGSAVLVVTLGLSMLVKGIRLFGM